MFPIPFVLAVPSYPLLPPPIVSHPLPPRPPGIFPRVLTNFRKPEGKRIVDTRKTCAERWLPHPAPAPV